jgi:hypothetical protein
MTAVTMDMGVKTDDVDISDELLLYFQNKFCSQKARSVIELNDKPSIDSWESYSEKYSEKEAFQVLQNCYPQLRFPIKEGINKEQEYINAVLKGKTVFTSSNNYLALIDPMGIKVIIHDSIAGKIPVVIVPNNQDFVKIVQCIVHRNNPIPVPNSMGALLVNGVNNWERIQSLKINWLTKYPPGDWGREFSKNILPNPDLFKDKLIILSAKPYSNVPANQVGMLEESWHSLSHLIRLEHEFTHLYTLKKYGFASNNLHDELVSDYIAIAKTVGVYKKEWMLKFMGLENYPSYRKGARLENYARDIGKSATNFRQLISVIYKAICNIAIFDSQAGGIQSDQDQMMRIDTLCETSVLEIASKNGSSILIDKYRIKQNRQ